MITVKFIELGSEVTEYALEDGSTVEDLFDLVGETFVQGSVTRRNVVVNENTTLYDGDKIFNGKSTKGNLDPFEVAFVKLGDSTLNLPAQDGYTIKQTLEQASEEDRSKFFRADGSSAYEYRVGGRRVEDTHTLVRPADGSIVKVICSQKVKGN